jgi:hypothetical protein
MIGTSLLANNIGGLIVPLTYQSRVVDDSGVIADSARSLNVYLDITSVAEPSLLCACDAYKATVLYNVIPE